jgi:pimeloyl-ACP methyl ester carboxylesterase
MQEFWFDSEGVPLFAVEDGSGPVIVMLHGGMASHLAALPLVAPLSSRYRVVVPDLRGSGKSISGAALSFDQLAGDVGVLLDLLGSDCAIVARVSGGCGVALRFALRCPGRVAGLVLVRPIHAGEERGYTEQQRASFSAMDAVASRAIDEGVEVLAPLYAGLPSPMRERALKMVEDFDAASVVATSQFLASGVQPFSSLADLASLTAPTLLVCGDDLLHPHEVSELYASNIPNCTVLPASVVDIAAAIGNFAETLDLAEPGRTG